MIIDNKRSVVGVKLRWRFFLLLLCILIVLSLFRETFLGIDRIVYILSFTGFYCIYYLWGIIRDYHYFYCNDIGIKLIFKYYSLAPFSKRLRSIEIDKNRFYKFNLEKKWMGLRLYLSLFQQSSGGIAKYPPISLGLVRRKDVRAIKTMLLKAGG
jgi:hypothetical protein